MFDLALTLSLLLATAAGMMIGHWLRGSSRLATRYDLQQMVDKIMATQAELEAQLQASTEQAAKIGGETRTLLIKIEDLLAQLTNASEVSPELQAAADALKAQLDAVDALVPDAPAA